MLATFSDALKIISDGQTIALGGMTLYRRPVAFVHHLLARKPRPQNLTLLAFTAGYESDLLVGTGCVSKVRTCYFGLESFGFAPMFTQAAQSGAIEVIEETEASIVMGIRARLAGVGFLPSTAWIGTDLPNLRPDVKTIQDPYSGEEYIAFPSISVDVAVVHGLEADYQGNVRLNNNLGIDLELIYVAQTVIVTVETIVEKLTPSAIGPIIPRPAVDVIIHAPNGAWPTSCYPLYPVDGYELLRYLDSCHQASIDDYLAKLFQQPLS